MLMCFGVSFLTVRKVGFIVQGDEIKEVHLEVTRGAARLCDVGLKRDSHYLLGLADGLRMVLP